ncbi:unnamed protein product [Effrenium voratum]|uniref:Uncharacterized protein n=1 Tax=Effrenium voratum TaxID=2562239 RepID=A0AA36MKW3_9DINO|nr:unnamed protein product [Effrenium voratum]CAJ1412495.1 unnamed protein product [Effrenium voratum]
MQHMTRPDLALMAVEKYAGVKTIATAFAKFGFTSASFEVQDDGVFQNILTGLGFAYGLALTLRLYKSRGFNFEAPVCSTWIWLNRPGPAFLYHLRLQSETCIDFSSANTMVARTCIYLYILSTLGLCWCIEQPASSLLEKHVCFEWLSKQCTVYKAFVWMGSYGGGCGLAFIQY